MAHAPAAMATGDLYQWGAQPGRASTLAISHLPWTGFAFVGLAVGFLLLSEQGRKRETLSFVVTGAIGLAVIVMARGLNRQHQIYPVNDFWHTSTNFFLIRVGIVLGILSASYAWCRWGPARWAFSPLIQLGQTSLLVYWVHIEFVYGRFSILTKKGMSIRGPSLGLLTIFVAMLFLSLGRTGLKGKLRVGVHRFRLSSLREPRLRSG